MDALLRVKVAGRKAREQKIVFAIEAHVELGLCRAGPGATAGEGGARIDPDARLHPFYAD